MNLKTSILDYIHDVKSGSLTVEEFTSATIQRIKDVDDDVHAYLSLNESAIDDARVIDKKISAGEKVGACYGLPISIKDNICIIGTKTTCASKILENFVAPYTATVVSKLQNEDVIITGKTNLDEFAMGSSTENSAFFPTRNPWNTDMVPGGSSGGPAAAVAAGECTFSLGSDTGGSIRQPASFCGVVGMKPTYGLVSRYGLVAFASSLDQIGPLTADVEDSAILLNCIAGLDEKDSTSLDVPKRDYTSALKEDLTGLKIGIPKEYFIEGMDPDVQRLILDALDVLKHLGAEVS